MARDHTFDYDYDYSGIEYLKAHKIHQLFQDITARLLIQRPLHCLPFILNILIHKIIQEQDHTNSTKLSLIKVPSTKRAPMRSYSDSAIMFNDDINNNNNKLNMYVISPVMDNIHIQEEEAMLLSFSNITKYIPDPSKLKHQLNDELEFQPLRRTRSWTMDRYQLLPFNDQFRWNIHDKLKTKYGSSGFHKFHLIHFETKNQLQAKGDDDDDKHALCSRYRWYRWHLEAKLMLHRLPLIVLCVAVQFAHSTASNYAYFRHIPSEPLYDFGFELIPQINDSMRDISELITLGIVISIFVWSFISFFSHPTPVHWTTFIVRVLVVMALCTILRCVCFLSTALPGPAPHCLANSVSYNPPQTRDDILWRKHILSGCGDLMFSSHTAVSMIFILALQTYLHLFMDTNKFNIILYGLYWPLLFVQVLFIIASRKHYTVDVIVALYTTPFVWNLSYAIMTDFQSELTILYQSKCCKKNV